MTRLAKLNRAEAMRTVSPLLGPALLVIALVVLSTFTSGSTQRAVTNGLVSLVIVLGLYMFVGTSGVLSFGHIGFAAIGAYTSALLTIPLAVKGALLPDLPGFLANANLDGTSAAIIAGLVAALVALLLGMAVMRLNEISIPIALLSFLVIVNVVASNWEQLTRGTGSMIGIPRTTGLWAATAWVLVALVAAFLFQQSRTGLKLRGAREDEPAARAVGINIWRERVIAFTVSAFFVAIGGNLIAHQLGSIAPVAFYLDLTFTTLAMLIIGGKNCMAGAVVGTFVVTGLSEVLRHAERGVEVSGIGFGATPGLRQVGVALVMLLCLAFRPAGITRGREFVFPPRRPPKRLARAGGAGEVDRPASGSSLISAASPPNQPQ